MRGMFYSAAAFNFAMALIFAFCIEQGFELLSIAPVPSDKLTAQLFAAMVFAFGVAYYWIARNPARSRQLIVFGAAAKTLMFAVAVLQTLSGIVSWQILIPAGGDLFYAVLFIRAYKQLD